MIKNKHLFVALAVAGVLSALGAGLYWAGVQHGMHTAMPAMGGGDSSAGGGKVDPANGKKILYWHDPMVPGQRFDKPGKSPFMDMQLVPVYADEAGAEHGVSISPQVQQNLGVRTVVARRGPLAPVVNAVGNVAYNERELVVLQARSSGFIERVYVRAPFERVTKGQPLAELYVPDWVAAQEEFFTVKRMGDAAGGLLYGARQRMRLAGMTDAQIRQVEASDKVHARLTVTAPLGGVVTELGVREGMTVGVGTLLFRINGLRSVWVEAELPEAMAGQVPVGSPIEARAAALPSTVLKGKVAALLPRLDPATRTLQARIELDNPGGRLVPGMFVTVDLSPARGVDVLQVPSEAVIRTGTRSVVIVARGEGSFAPVEVQTGLEANGQTEIRQGLEAGQQVVLSGQFLIDSEASLRGAMRRLSPTPEATRSGKAAVKPTHRGEGRVESIGPDEIVLSHGPIPTLKWPAMTMGFKLPAAGLPKDVAVGDTVTFTIAEVEEGSYQVLTIARAASAGSRQWAAQ